MIFADDAIPSLDQVLQSVLAGENACVYAYGLIGALSTGSARTRARVGLAEHSAARDRIRRVLIDRKQVPAPAAAAYNPPFPVTDAQSASHLAAVIEDRLALVLADLVGAAKANNNAGALNYAVAAIEACAVRSTNWSGTVQAFPGLLS